MTGPARRGGRSRTARSIRWCRISTSRRCARAARLRCVGAGATAVGKARLELRSSNAGGEGNRIAVTLDYAPGSHFERDAKLALLSAPREVRAAASTPEGPSGAPRSTGGPLLRHSPSPRRRSARCVFARRRRRRCATPSLDGNAPGPGCIQATGASPFGGAPARQSEDCLQLNVWRPAGAGPFPVMVWIHGGGRCSARPSTSSAIASPTTAPRSRAAASSFVSINYRLERVRLSLLREFAGEAADQPAGGQLRAARPEAALHWVRPTSPRSAAIRPTSRSSASPRAGSASATWSPRPSRRGCSRRRSCKAATACATRPRRPLHWRRATAWSPPRVARMRPAAPGVHARHRRRAAARGRLAFGQHRLRRRRRVLRREPRRLRAGRIAGGRGGTGTAMQVPSCWASTTTSRRR